MPKMKKILTVLPSLLACTLVMTNPVCAEQRYVVDTIVVSLREGPGSQYRAIKSIQTGQAMEVLETKDDFLRVKTPEGDEGWLPTRYAASQPTKANLVQELQEKVTALSSHNEQLTARLAGTAPQSANGENELPALNKLQAKLNSMTEQYNLLEADARDTLHLRDENTRLTSELAALRAQMAQLLEDKESHAIPKNIYWFLAGGAVFFIGWITGKISFRRQRHSLTL